MARIREQRRKKEEDLPRLPLEAIHVRNCDLVLDRTELLAELEANATVAEVGVAAGDFSASILSETKPDKLHLIDVWGSDRYGENKYRKVLRRFESEVNCGTVNIHRQNSIASANEFEDNYFDWIYIDTDHSYETTRKELLSYAPKVKEGGVIAGHDYTIGNWTDGIRYGVIEAVHEFCIKHNWKIAYLTAEPIEHRSFAIRRINSQ